MFTYSLHQIILQIKRGLREHRERISTANLKEIEGPCVRPPQVFQTMIFSEDTKYRRINIERAG